MGRTMPFDCPDCGKVLDWGDFGPSGNDPDQAQLDKPQCTCHGWEWNGEWWEAVNTPDPTAETLPIEHQRNVQEPNPDCRLCRGRGLSSMSKWNADTGLWEPMPCRCTVPPPAPNPHRLTDDWVQHYAENHCGAHFAALAREVQEWRKNDWTNALADLRLSADMIAVRDLCARHGITVEGIVALVDEVME